jgi:hypothetical protein
MGLILFLQASVLNPGNLIVILISSADLMKRKLLTCERCMVTEAERMAEENVKIKSHGRSERHCIVGREREHCFGTRFLGFTRWSF